MGLLKSGAKISSASVQQVGAPWWEVRALEAGLCVHIYVCACVYICVAFFYYYYFLFFWAVLGSGTVLCQALGRQQRGFEGAGSGALTGGEHLAGEMVKGVVSFWGGTSPSVRTCSGNADNATSQTTDDTMKCELDLCLL